MNTRLPSEVTRLRIGPSKGELPQGIGLEKFRVQCAGNARQVLHDAKAVMLIVAEKGVGEWPTDGQWPSLLPRSFVTACAPEMTRREASEYLAQRNRMSLKERAAHDAIERDRPWSLLNWLYFLQPEERQWYWWDAELVEPDVIVLSMEVEGWPYPWEALRWLFRACGAVDMYEANPT